MDIIQPIRRAYDKITSIFLYGTDSIVLNERAFSKSVSFQHMFLRKAPVIVEFGVGKGRFMKEYALKFPHFNFFGVEKINKWIKHTARRVEKAGLSNVRLVNAIAEHILSQIPPESVNEYYILFSDPWPKRRQNHRRLVQKELIEQIHKTLVPYGKLYIATDHREYYEWIVRILSGFLGREFESVTHEKIEFVSNYQIKYEREGRPIYTVHLKKLTTSPVLSS